MANELTINASLAYADAEDADELLAVVNKMANVSTKAYIKHKQNIGTSEEALDLGGLTSMGYAIFVNRDSTNYVEIRSATGAGNDIIKLLAGEVALFRFGSDITAPFAIANTATVQLEYLIIST